MADSIHSAYLSDVSVCDELIQLFTVSDNKTPGLTTAGVDRNIKASTEISFHAKEIDYVPALKKYFLMLQEVCNQYIHLYPASNSNAPWRAENFNIQHYAPGEGYYAWNCERGGAQHVFNRRRLAWMTYLNDVNDAGGTEFLHQKQTIQPHKGLTMIWPVDWTHTHRGVPSPTENKYIITGWYEYV